MCFLSMAHLLRCCLIVYFEGATHPLQIYTNHKNLEYFSQARTTSRRHAKWAATLAAYDYTIIYRKGASNGKAHALSRNPDLLPPPLTSLPIFPPSDPILNSPHLLGAAVLVMPNDPLLPPIVAAQAADPIPSAHIQELQRGLGGESNPALPKGSPSGGSEVLVYTLHGGLLYS